MRVKEYFEWTVQEKLFMPDMYGQRGIDLFDQAGIEFVDWNAQADLGLSKNGEGILGVPKKKTLLMVFEPPNQLPWIYSPEVLQQYGSLMSSTRIPGVDQFYIPRAFNHVERYFNLPKTDLLCMIGRDMSCNGHPDKDLTGLRRTLIDFFADKLGPGKFNLYGRWRPNRCYRGEIGPTAHGLAGYNLTCPATKNQQPCWDGKYAVLAKHKFTLALENSMWPGYFGCKMIEAMQCGSIPLYIGDPEIDNHTPSDVYIDMRGKSPEELLAIITSMDENTINKYRERIWKYLNDQGNTMFSSYSFGKKFLAALQRIQ